MSANVADPRVLRGPLRLADDVSIVDIADLPEELSGQLEADAGDKLLSRTRSRDTSKVIDADLARLVESFREPMTLVKAVVAFGGTQAGDSKSADLHRLLEDAVPVVSDFVRAGILRPDNSGDDDDVDVSSPSTATLLPPGVAKVRSLQSTEDSEIYQGRRDGTFVAVKTARVGHAEWLGRLLHNEARVLRQLAGSGVPEVVEVGQVDGRDYLVTSWVEGTTVDRVAEERRTSADRAGLLAVIRAVVAAYEDLERRGVRHGDVHPGNVLVNGDDVAILVDFGNAFVADNPPSHALGGVSFFTSPEQAVDIRDKRRPRPATLESELFAVGSLVYLLATGSYYADFSLRQEVMYGQVCEVPPRSFVDAGAESWPELERVLGQALAKSPADRFASFGDFGRALDDIASSREANESRERNASPSSSISSGRGVWADSVLDALHPAASLFRDGLPHGPRCNVHMGAAGVAYALLRVARLRDDADLLARARLWIARARADVDESDAFDHPSAEYARDAITPHSVLHGRPGIDVVQGLIAATQGETWVVGAATESFLDHVSDGDHGDDFVLGTLSAVHGAIMLLETTESILDDDVAARLRDFVQRHLDAMWSSRHRAESLTDSRDNLGIAHGWTGLLIATHRWGALGGRIDRAGFDRRIGELIGAMWPIGRGATIPWRSGSGEGASSMPGWCNGAAGVIHLVLDVAATLADDDPRRGEFDAVVRKLAWHAFETEVGLSDLCCGLAGRALAVARFAAWMGDDAVWHSRARRLLDVAIERAAGFRGEDHPFHSLHKGELGLAVAAEEIDRADEPEFPFCGLEL